MLEDKKVVKGTYGSLFTPCNVFIYKNWYCVEGGTIINKATWYTKFYNGIDVEDIQDVDCFTVNEGIHSLDELIQFVDEE